MSNADIQELNDLLKWTRDKLQRALAERDEVGVQLVAAQKWITLQRQNWDALRELIAGRVTNDDQRADILRWIDTGTRSRGWPSDTAPKTSKEGA